MCFKNIYEKVEELKIYSVNELVELFDIELIYDDELEVKSFFTNYYKPTIAIKTHLNELERDIVVLHEIGHCLFNRDTWLYNQRTNENNANLFMCLFLLKNDIWSSEYHQKYLINCGVDYKIANQMNEMIRQYKMQSWYRDAWSMLET